MEAPRPRQIVIAGAGIAGLTAALAFARHGFSVRILEKSARLEQTGAGLQLSPNATRILEILGVMPHLAGRTLQPKCVEMRDARSLSRLAAVPLGRFAQERWGAPYLVMARAALQDALLQRATEASIAVETDARVTDFSLGADGVEISLTRNGEATVLEGDLLVGADGVWSTIRGLGPDGGSLFSGQLAWRATISPGSVAHDHLDAVAPGDRVTAFAHPRFHLIAYPLADGAINVVAIAKGRPLPEEWSRAASAVHMRGVLANAAPPLAALADEASWTVWPLHIANPNCGWTNPECLALIGDAAHAIPPFAAQGAAMAIEDAFVLAHLVAHAPSMAEALARYDTMRRPRIRKVALRGGINRLAWHARGPVALARNLVFRLRGDAGLAADLDWLYGWNAEEALRDI